MRRYIVNRLLHLIPVIFGITFLSFVMMHFAGSDAVTEMYSNAEAAVSEDVINAARARLGLDRPFLAQYVSWLGGMMTGDMGVSYVSGRNVFEIFIGKVPATLMLTAMSIVLTVVISIPLGVISAVAFDKASNDDRPKQRLFYAAIDYVIRFLSFIGNSLPNFFVALILMNFLAIKFKLLPVIADGVNFRAAIMPTLALAIAMSSKYSRQVRAAVLDELAKDYVTGARARGVRESVILRKSVMKSAMLTIVTLLALSIGSLLGGTAIIESIFMWDGVGKLAVEAIMMRDYPVIQAYVVWMSMIYVAVNLITDILYFILDPRIRFGAESK